MVIQHNMTAINANRQLNITNIQKSKSSEKLSSGYKINRAADDASGLAISEKMRRQIRGLSQASQNVQDGISFVQVADGALVEIDKMLARMTQLCVQAATDTLTAEDREAINKEIQQIKMESNRIFHVTSFNERPIWDENNMQPVVVGQESRPIFTSSVNTVGSITQENRAAWPSDQQFKFSASDSGLKIKWKGYDGTDYESNEMPWPSEEDMKNGFTVRVDENTMDYSKYPNAKQINPTYTFKLDKDATKDMLISNLNGRTASVRSSYTVSGTVKGDTGNSYISGNWSYLTGLMYRTSATGQEDNMDPDNGGNNRLQSNTASTMSYSFQFGKDAEAMPSSPSTFPVTVSYSNSVSTSVGTQNDDTRSIWWNKVGNFTFGRNPSTGGTDLEAAVRSALGPQHNTFNNTDQELRTFGGTLMISLGVTAGEALTYGSSGSQLQTGTGQMGGLTLYMTVAQGETTDHVIERIKGITGIDLTSTSSNGLSRGTVSSPYFMGNIYGGAMKLDIQAGADNTAGDIIPIVYEVLNNHVLGIENLNTLTSTSAKQGIGIIKNAAEIVDEERAIFGAYQNRMEHTLKNLGNVIENTTSAESLIRDTDMDEELVKFYNHMILSHTGDAMLAKANQTKQGVLSLLQE